MFRSQLPNSTNNRSINYPCSCAILNWLRKLLNLALRFNNYRHIQFDLIKNCDQRFWTAINLTYSCCRFLSWENNGSGSSTMRLSLRTLEINSLGWKKKGWTKINIILGRKTSFHYSATTRTRKKIIQSQRFWIQKILSYQNGF